MNRRNSQHSWDAVRSQVMAQLARCEAPGGDGILPSEDRRIFRADDVEPYYGPTREAREAINLLLDVDAAAGQLEWEAEIGDGGQLNGLVDALGDASFNTETRSAIALLLLDHLDRISAWGTSGTELLARIRWHLRADARVQARMRYWWTHMEGSGAVMEALS